MAILEILEVHLSHAWPYAWGNPRFHPGLNLVPSPADSVDVPALALQLKSSFSASLRGAAERLGLLEGQQAQLRNELPLILIESLSSDLHTPLSCSRVMGE